MIEKRTFCDVCKTQSPAEVNKSMNIHWTETFGPAVIDFKKVPAHQRIWEFSDICPRCAKKIIDSVEQTIKTIKTKSEGRQE